MRAGIAVVFYDNVADAVAAALREDCEVICFPNVQLCRKCLSCISFGEQSLEIGAELVFAVSIGRKRERLR